MGKNLLTLAPRLVNTQHEQNIAWVWDCPRDFVFLRNRQKTIERLLEASMLFRGSYAATAAILQQDD